MPIDRQTDQPTIQPTSSTSMTIFYSSFKNLQPIQPEVGIYRKKILRKHAFDQEKTKIQERKKEKAFSTKKKK